VKGSSVGRSATVARNAAKADKVGVAGLDSALGFQNSRGVQGEKPA
jgi:ribosomal protein S19E (S16A)